MLVGDGISGEEPGPALIRIEHSHDTARRSTHYLMALIDVDIASLSLMMMVMMVQRLQGKRCRDDSREMRDEAHFLLGYVPCDFLSPAGPSMAPISSL